MTPKEALQKDGFPVKMGQGRLSGAGIARCKELAAKGWVITGYSVSQNVDQKTTPTVTKTTKVTGLKDIADLPPERYDEKEWKAISSVPVFGSTVFGMREVCGTCHNSLTYHWCNDPVILGVPVTIVRR